MAQSTCIELRTGPGRHGRVAGAALWGSVALLLACIAGRLPAALTFAGAIALLSELPCWWSRAARDGRVRLYRDGSMLGPEGGGSWMPAGWSTAWLTVVELQCDARHRRVLVAPWRNDPDVYRVLRSWLRLPPHEQLPDRRGAFQ